MFKRNRADTVNGYIYLLLYSNRSWSLWNANIGYCSCYMVKKCCLHSIFNESVSFDVNEENRYRNGSYDSDTATVSHVYMFSIAADTY